MQVQDVKDHHHYHERRWASAMNGETPRNILIALTIAFVSRSCVAFLPHKSGRISSVFRPASDSSTTNLGLIPIRNFRDELTFLSKSDDVRCCLDSDGVFRDPVTGDSYELGLIEEQDLVDTSRFIVQTFGADAIRLSQDLNSFEEMIMKPAFELINGYSGIVAFAEVLAGLRIRLSQRFADRGIDPPKLQGLKSREEKINVASGSAIVLVLAKSREGSDWHIDVIGSMELRLQPCDAKIPFSLPWLDRIERRLGSLTGLGNNESRDLEPYLSNLCVAEDYRGKGIGRALVHCVEDIAASNWGFSRMYLHVDEDNTSALQLYKSEGYKDVGLRWRPFWAGKASDIGYYVKKFK
jgi:ribosomal protein S18 acetylase RimI-like enzyme